MSLRPEIATTRITKPGTPYTDGTGLNCRIPSTRLSLTPEATHLGAPVLVMGMDTNDLFHFPFHGFQTSAQQCLSTAHLRISVVLIITILPTLVQIIINDSLCTPSSKRRKMNLRCRTYISSTRILTGLPFPKHLLGARLGPTDPWLICIAKEPLPFRR